MNLTDINMSNIGQIRGMNVITSNHMVVQKGMKDVKKTWKERVTWKFWESTKSVPNYVPDPTILLDTVNNAIICHPELAENIRLRCAL